MVMRRPKAIEEILETLKKASEQKAQWMKACSSDWLPKEFVEGKTRAEELKKHEWQHKAKEKESIRLGAQAGRVKGSMELW